MNTIIEPNTEMIEEMELQERLFPMRENWHLLQPYLNDKDVQRVLNDAMTEFCKQHPNRIMKMWESGDAPWEYTTTSYWLDKATDAVNEHDEEFRTEEKELRNEWLRKLYGQNVDLEGENLWDELEDNEEYTEQWHLLFQKHEEKYYPKEGTMEWYQFIHGCHWINQFTAALVSKALNVEAFVYETTTHTCATFVKDDVVYYADVQLEWNSLQELMDFFGEEVDFYPVFD